MNRLLQRLDEGKLYYSISEVCRMTGLEAHVLRYWETEFAQMRPRKNRAGNRAYRPREIQYIQYIRHLLHEEKYTLQGAKKKLSEVSFEEVSGQTTLLRVPPAKPEPKIETKIEAKPESQETVSAAGMGVGETSGFGAMDAGMQQQALQKTLDDAKRRELESIRDGLKDVLKLLGQ
jgi:DNA-binding transcriptional MerR regulator